MPKQELHKTIQELQLELEKLNFENEAHRDRVNQSVTDFEKKLLDESFMSGDEFLVHEIKEALEEFETSHPRLTDLVGRVSDLFAKMGI